MKRHLLSILLFLSLALSASAIPAKPGKTTVTQPDGSTVTLVLHGDEFTHFTTTIDNYTVVKTPSGYQYALKEGGVLVPSGITARDAAARTADEKAFLSTVDRNLLSDTDVAGKEEMRRARSLWNTAAGGTAAPQKARYNYGNFRGLVILVEWNDLSFTRTDAKTFFSSMINDKGYTGYYTQSSPQQWVSCTGSVRDYFSDNSMGLFQPKFDVVGPVKINRSHKFPQGAAYAYLCAKDAIEAANSLVDYSQYDTDGDGKVDMFYIIYAGYGSNVVGNDESYIWPHATSYAYPYITYDGVRMGRYACSTELCGSEIYNQKTLDGIGTICHEFSHVLGLPDLYDTDYAENGQSDDPGVWSIMAGGGYNNNSRTPTGYGAYERYAIGFMQPETITEEGGTYTLEAIDTSNKAYRIDSSVDDEYFLLENRQQTRWDAYLPGSGMLVFRVDSTDASKWTSNTVNCYPEHNYYEMLRANPYTYNGAIVESAGDPFPGTGNVMEINNETEPSLCSWTGAPTPLSLNSIKETAGVISFTVGGAEVDQEIEDFEAMELTDADATGLQGVFCKWDMTKTRIIKTAGNYGTGQKALGIARGGSVTSSVIEKGISTMEFDFWNPTRANAIISVQTSTDGGTTWTPLENTDGQARITVQAGKNGKQKFMANLPAGSMIRIQQTSGLPTEYCCIDNIKVMFSNSTPTGISHITTGTGAATVSETYYNISGQRVSADTKGLVIVKTRTADGRTVTRKVIK